MTNTDVIIKIDDVVKDIQISNLSINRKPNAATSCSFTLNDKEDVRFLGEPRLSGRRVTIYIDYEGYKNSDTPIFDGFQSGLSGKMETKTINLLSPFHILLNSVIDPALIRELHGEHIYSVLRDVLFRAKENVGFMSTGRSYNFGIDVAQNAPRFDGGKLSDKTNKTQSITVNDIVQRCLELANHRTTEEMSVDDSYYYGKYCYHDIEFRNDTTFLFTSVLPSGSRRKWFELEYSDVTDANRKDLRNVSFTEREVVECNEVIIPWQDQGNPDATEEELSLVPQGTYRYSNTSRQRIEGRKPLIFDNQNKFPLYSNGQAYELGRAIILSSLSEIKYGLSVESDKLFDCYPLLSAVKIVNHPKINPNDLYMVTEVTLKEKKAVATLGYIKKQFTDVVGSPLVIGRVRDLVNFA